LYSASEVTARVADGQTVAIAETTRYPFDEKIEFKIKTAQAVKFPLYLRVPKWTMSAVVRVNGENVSIQMHPPCYLVIEREWKDGDSVTLELPMQTRVRTWVKNNNSVS